MLTFAKEVTRISHPRTSKKVLFTKQCFKSFLIFRFIKSKKKESHSVLKLKVTSSNHLFYPSNNLKPQNIPFTFIHNKQKQQIFIHNKVVAINVRTFFLLIDRSTCSFSLILVTYQPTYTHLLSLEVNMDINIIIN